MEKVIRMEVSSNIKIRREDQERYYNAHKDEYQRQNGCSFRTSTFRRPERMPRCCGGRTEGEDLACARASRREIRGPGVQTSSDDANAPTGGEMPPFEKGQLAKELEDVLWTKDKGYISDPIKRTDPAGFYVFKVEDHQKAGLAQSSRKRRPKWKTRCSGPRWSPRCVRI